MKQINFDVMTGETTIVEVPDVEMPIIEETPTPTIESRLDAMEGTTEEIVVVLNDKGLIP